MWRIKIIRGKDCLKEASGTWAFPSKYKTKGYSKTINLLLNMTEPIHRTSKLVTGNSGFCIAMGVMALQKFGVHGQFQIKKRKYWPKHVPGNYIYGYMATKPLGRMETFIQEMEGQQFLVHCTKDRDYGMKIMSTHGVLDEIQDNAMWRLMDGMWRTFKYAKPFSRHNCAKHWVDDVNNLCHDPSLEDVWATKWWPNWQFTFLLSVAEVNTVQARARAKKEWQCRRWNSAKNWQCG